MLHFKPTIITLVDWYTPTSFKVCLLPEESLGTDKFSFRTCAQRFSVNSDMYLGGKTVVDWSTIPESFLQ